MPYWFINEDGEVYPFDDPVRQQSEYPGDNHVPYATQKEAEFAAEKLIAKAQSTDSAPFTLASILLDFEKTQQGPGNEGDDSPTLDVMLHIDAGEMRRMRGFVSYREGDEFCAIYQRVLIRDTEAGDRPLMSWRNEKFEGGQTRISEVPIHVRLDRIVMVEWASNDYGGQ